MIRLLVKERGYANCNDDLLFFMRINIQYGLVLKCGKLCWCSDVEMSIILSLASDKKRVFILKYKSSVINVWLDYIVFTKLLVM